MIATLCLIVGIHLTQSCHFLQGDMNHIIEGAPIFRDLGGLIGLYGVVAINPKYWDTLKRR
jgi:hypothetical protein